MRRVRVTVASTLMLAALAAGCAGPAPAGTPPAVRPPASDTPATVPRAGAVSRAGAERAGIYEQVLRRYLSTPAENSFPGRTFKTVYVLNQAYADAADPNGEHGRGEPVASATQRQVTAALAGMAHIVFIANRGSVIEAGNGCGQVKGGGILITLGLPAGHAGELRVGINGYVACLGATWLTYVLKERLGGGWRVAGTTGSMTVA